MSILGESKLEGILFDHMNESHVHPMNPAKQVGDATVEEFKRELEAVLRDCMRVPLPSMYHEPESYHNQCGQRYLIKWLLRDVLNVSVF